MLGFVLFLTTNVDTIKQNLVFVEAIHSFHIDRLESPIFFQKPDNCAFIPTETYNPHFANLIALCEISFQEARVNKILAEYRPTDGYFAGLLYARSGMWTDAVSIWQKAQVPTNAFLQQRNELYANGKIDELIFQSQAALRLSPVIGASSYPYNDLLEAANDFEAWGFEIIAKDLLILMAQQWPKDTWEHWHYMVRAASLNGDQKDILQTLEEARSFFPENTYFINRQIGFLYQINQFDEVLELADEWQTYQPENAMPHYFKGLAWFRKGNYVSAQNEFILALDIAGDSDQKAKILVEMGNLAKAQGALAEAKDYYEQVLIIDPQNNDARSGLDAIK